MVLRLSQLAQLPAVERGDVSALLSSLDAAPPRAAAAWGLDGRTLLHAAATTRHASTLDVVRVLTDCCLPPTPSSCAPGPGWQFSLG